MPVQNPHTNTEHHTHGHDQNLKLNLQNRRQQMKQDQQTVNDNERSSLHQNWTYRSPFASPYRYQQKSAVSQYSSKPQILKTDHEQPRSQSTYQNNDETVSQTQNKNNYSTLYRTLDNSQSYSPIKSRPHTHTHAQTHTHSHTTSFHNPPSFTHSHNNNQHHSFYTNKNDIDHTQNGNKEIFPSEMNSIENDISEIQRPVYYHYSTYLENDNEDWVKANPFEKRTKKVKHSLLETQAADKDGSNSICGIKRKLCCLAIVLLLLLGFIALGLVLWLKGGSIGGHGADVGAWNSYSNESSEMQSSIDSQIPQEEMPSKKPIITNPVDIREQGQGSTQPNNQQQSDSSEEGQILSPEVQQPSSPQFSTPSYNLNPTTLFDNNRSQDRIERSTSSVNRTIAPEQETEQSVDAVEVPITIIYPPSVAPVTNTTSLPLPEKAPIKPLNRTPNATFFQIPVVSNYSRDTTDKQISTTTPTANQYLEPELFTVASKTIQSKSSELSKDINGKIPSDTFKKIDSSLLEPHIRYIYQPLIDRNGAGDKIDDSQLLPDQIPQANNQSSTPSPSIVPVPTMQPQVIQPSSTATIAPEQIPLPIDDRFTENDIQQFLQPQAQINYLQPQKVPLQQQPQMIPTVITPPAIAPSSIQQINPQVFIDPQVIVPSELQQANEPQQSMKPMIIPMERQQLQPEITIEALQQSVDQNDYSLEPQVTYDLDILGIDENEAPKDNQQESDDEPISIDPTPIDDQQIGDNTSIQAQPQPQPIIEEEPQQQEVQLEQLEPLIIENDLQVDPQSSLAPTLEIYASIDEEGSSQFLEPQKNSIMTTAVSIDKENGGFLLPLEQMEPERQNIENEAFIHPQSQTTTPVYPATNPSLEEIEPQKLINPSIVEGGNDMINPQVSFVPEIVQNYDSQSTVDRAMSPEITFPAQQSQLQAATIKPWIQLPESVVPAVQQGGLQPQTIGPSMIGPQQGTQRPIELQPIRIEPSVIVPEAQIQKPSAIEPTVITPSGKDDSLEFLEPSIVVPGIVTPSAEVLSPSAIEPFIITEPEKETMPEYVEPSILTPTVIVPQGEVTEPWTISPQIIKPGVLTPQVSIPQPENLRPFIIPETQTPPSAEFQPSIIKPSPITPEAESSQAVQPSPIKPEVITPSVENPETVEPSPIKPQVITPETENPETVQPSPVKPEVITPEVENPETVEPSPVKPEVVTPEVENPETVQPTPVKPETIKPQAQPQISQPSAPEPISPTVVQPIKPSQPFLEPEISINPQIIKPTPAPSIPASIIGPAVIEPQIVPFPESQPQQQTPQQDIEFDPIKINTTAPTVNVIEIKKDPFQTPHRKQPYIFPQNVKRLTPIEGKQIIYEVPQDYEDLNELYRIEMDFRKYYGLMKLNENILPVDIVPINLKKSQPLSGQSEEQVVPFNVKRPSLYSQVSPTTEVDFDQVQSNFYVFPKEQEIVPMNWRVGSIQQVPTQLQQQQNKGNQTEQNTQSEPETQPQKVPLNFNGLKSLYPKESIIETFSNGTYRIVQKGDDWEEIKPRIEIFDKYGVTTEYPANIKMHRHLRTNQQ